MNISFGNKLRQLREERDLTLDEVARLINERYERNISKSMLSKWENGKEEPRRFQDAAGLAQFYGVSTDWLMGISDDKFNEGGNKMDKFRRIPILGTIAAGVPIFAQEDVIGHEIVNESQGVDFCLKVKGDSMIGACINDGDTVFIRQQQEVETGEIAAVIIDGEATLKRFYKINGNVILRPENVKHKDIVLTAKEAKQVQILGKVAYIKSEAR